MKDAKFVSLCIGGAVLLGIAFNFTSELSAMGRQKNKIKEDKIHLFERELALREKELAAKEVWTVIRGDEKSPFVILNKNNGKAFRYYRNVSADGEVEYEGLAPLIYSMWGANGMTPEEAEKSYLKKIDEEKVKKSLKE